MKRIITILLLALSFGAQAQFNSTLHTSSNKPYAPNGKPTDARSYYYDAGTFTYRPYASRAEILSYLNTTASRTGNFPIFMDSASQRWELSFKNGTTDADLTYSNPITGGSSNTFSTRDFNNTAGAIELKQYSEFYSAYRATQNAFGGDTSIMIVAGVIRPTIAAGTDSVTWSWIADVDHTTLNMLPTVTASGSQQYITINYPSSYKVITLLVGPDEQLAKFGIQAGASVGVSSANIHPKIINNWGGYVVSNGTTYVSTGAYNNTNPTVSFNATTGQISLDVTGIETLGIADVYKVTATSTRPGYQVIHNISETTASSMKFYLLDGMGNVVRGSTPTNTGFFWRGATSFKGFDTQWWGGSNAWYKNIFTAASNFWVIGVLKKYN